MSGASYVTDLSGPAFGPNGGLKIDPVTVDGTYGIVVPVDYREDNRSLVVFAEGTFGSGTATVYVSFRNALSKVSAVVKYPLKSIGVGHNSGSVAADSAITFAANGWAELPYHVESVIFVFAGSTNASVHFGII